MGWISKGKKITQAVKNVQRLRQIIGVLSKHGFHDLINRMNLAKYLPAGWTPSQVKLDKDPAVHLREAFEELGPTFVKFGQLLSMRPDLIPESMAEEFTKLQEAVAPVPFEAIRLVIETELKGPMDRFFKSVDERPLAAASIAQVHVALLKSGESVVIKVQRPDIEKAIKNDISLLRFLARVLEKTVPESRMLNPSGLVDEFFRTLQLELDFFVEANNIERFQENMKDVEGLVIPKVYRDLTTSRILVLERIDGIRVTDIAALDQAGIDRSRVVELGSKVFFKSIMIDGLFHGDLHGGNVFVLPDSRIALVDFGIVGRLSMKSRDHLASMFLSLMTEDYENLCYQYAELGSGSPTMDFDGFQREVKDAISPYFGLKLSQVNTGKLLLNATRVAAKYQIRVPMEWMIVFRAMLTMEGMGRSLDPEFDLMTHGREMVKDLIKSQYSLQRLSRESLWMIKELVSLAQILPRQIKWMFRKFNRSDFALEIRIEELKHIRKSLEVGQNRISLAILTGACFIACSQALHYTADFAIFGYPAFAILFFLIGFLLLIRVLTL